jgi:hypothetical protein
LFLTLFTIVYDTKKGGLLNASAKDVAGDDGGGGGGEGGGVGCGSCVIVFTPPVSARQLQDKAPDAEADTDIEHSMQVSQQSCQCN